MSVPGQDEAQAAAAPRAAVASRRVAVLAVHGIGRHAAGETQNAMADLLLSLPTEHYDAHRAYAPFASVGLQIPLQPLRTGKHALDFAQTAMPTAAATAGPEKSMVRRFLNTFEEPSAEFAGSLAPREDPPADGAVATAYSDKLLEEYRGGADGNVYVTKRLEGQRLADGTAVDIYEVLWADLAKPDSSVVSFFMGLFQLLIHLGTLSRLTLDTGAAEATGKVWHLYRRVQRYAVRLLQVFIPLLEVLLLISISSCFSTLAKPTSGARAVAVLMGAAAATGVAFAFVNSGRFVARFGPRLWVVLALLPGVCGGCVAGTLIYATDANRAAAIFFWLVPGALLLAWILRNYDDLREGAKATGWAMFAVAFAVFLWFLCKRAADPNVVLLASLWTAKLLLAAVRMCWALLVSLALLAGVLGSYAWRWSWPKDPITENPEELARMKGRAKAAVRTSRLALALPSVLFTMVTVLIWSGFTKLTESTIRDPLYAPAVVAAPMPGATLLACLHLLPQGDFSPSETLTPRCWVGGSSVSVNGLEQGNAAADTALKGSDAYVAKMLAWSAGYQLPVTLALVVIAGFLLVWWALPSVLTERFPARGQAKSPRPSSNAESLHMGTWLSRGLDATAVVTLLLWCSIFLAPAAYFVLDVRTPNDSSYARWLLSALQYKTVTLVMGGGLVATALLAALAKGGEVVLSTVLDVDTYLRGTPTDATPRAKIFERYISTLRYLNNCGRYDSIVIVAHSLGALISGDLLHYLDAKKTESLHLPVRLLTMGNPSRQLLNRFFPYLYDWVRSVPDNGLHALGGPGGPKPVIASTELPNPKCMGVEQWVNAYRSGDYVGRSMWLNEWYQRPEEPRPVLVRSEDGLRVEVCIGAGAHTHYMDDTASDIAHLLNDLIDGPLR